MREREEKTMEDWIRRELEKEALEHFAVSYNGLPVQVRARLRSALTQRLYYAEMPQSDQGPFPHETAAGKADSAE